jgi:hypothetical protein
MSCDDTMVEGGGGRKQAESEGWGMGGRGWTVKENLGVVDPVIPVDVITLHLEIWPPPYA